MLYYFRVFIIILLVFGCRPNVDKGYMDQITFLETLQNLLRPVQRFSFSYSRSAYTLTLGSPIEVIRPTANRTIASCSSNQPLPPGLSLNSSCEISGTPTEPRDPYSYQIAAAADGLRSTFWINLSVTSSAPSGFHFPNSPFTFTQGINIEPQLPVVTGTITSCASNPSLPTGFILGSDCRITGNPVSIQGFTSYTVTASNSFGSTSATIHITVTADPPSGFSYPSASYVFTEGLSITPIHPSISGSLTGCSVSPPLPTGLIISLPDCALSGTPGVVVVPTDYTVTAINPYGSASTTVNLAVNMAPPSGLNYPLAAYTFTQNQTIALITPSFSGTVLNCSTMPALPPGLSIHGTTCAIEGTPTTIQGPTAYIITASNSTGSTTANLTLSINDAPPSGLVYTPTSYTFTQGVAITAVTPTITGTITNCVASPALPSGLGINPTTCAISGTPITLQAATTHTITASNVSGSVNTSISITVNVAPPTGLSYTPSAFTFTQGLPISPIVASFTGTVTNCVSSPALPTGLAIHPNTCEISGTPTGTQIATDYIITASNGSGNSNPFTLSIAINIAPPSGLSYPSSSYTFTQSATISPLIASYTGTVTNCSSTPALPPGLAINNVSCEINGTPTTVQGPSTYTITAANGSGNTSFDLSIAINIAPPSGLNYSPSAMTFTVALPITPVLPTYTGTITNCVSAPTLPSGLSLNPSNCEITGTPSVIQGATNYTITASNASGNTTANISITINLAPPSALTYLGSPYTFTEGIPITPITPTYLGTVTNCVASPGLPTGLSLNTTNCEITGTPTVIQSATVHNITASNGSGSTNVDISITVNVAPPSGLNFTGSPYVFTQGVGISTITPTFSGTVTDCIASPALPSGLSIHNTTCAISGTPTVMNPATNYLIIASNASGSSQFNINVTVNMAPPSGLNYAGNPFVFTQGIAISPLTPTYSGTVTNCVSFPALPTGLSLNTTTCQITGTPTNTQGNIIYTITASNISGSTSSDIGITVNIAPPSGLSYPSASYTFTENEVISTLVATYSGTVTTCTASPALPTGLGINNTNCQITGTPSSIQGATIHTITASNSSGSVTFDLTLTVNIAPPSGLTYTGGPFIFTQGIGISPLTPSFSGTVTSCTVDPALPAGLAINNTTCVISGTPSVDSEEEVYIVTASNSSGSVTANVALSVNVAPPNSLVYTGSPRILTQNTLMTAWIPTVNGSIASCSSSPSLPVGLSLSNVDCRITGTPTNTQAPTNYTITATNVSGSTNTTISIEVTLAAPSGLVYSGSPFSFTVDMLITPAVPTLVGTVTTCNSTPALPAGLAINNTTCAITGTPSGTQGSLVYTITASNVAGSTSTDISIAVTASAPSNLVYVGTPFVLLQGIASDPIVPTVDGSVTTCTSSPTLPAGLTINGTSCAISGTPSSLQVATNYTITASNAYGNTTKIISLTVERPGKLYMAYFTATTPRGSRYNNARTLTGSTTTNFGTTGANYSVALDRSRDILYMSDSAPDGTSIYVFKNASTNAGVPDVTFTCTSMVRPAGLAIDEVNDFLFVVTQWQNTNSTTNRKIFRVHTASTITSGAKTTGTTFRMYNIAVLGEVNTQVRRIALSSGMLYIADYGKNFVYVFHNMLGNINNNSNLSPNRTLTIPNGPAGVEIDATNNLLFISTFLDNKIKIYSNASTVNGTPVPDREIFNANLSGPNGLHYVPTLNRLYVASYNNESVLFYDNATTINGDLPPTRILSGFTNVTDVDIDLSR